MMCVLIIIQQHFKACAVSRWSYVSCCLKLKDELARGLVPRLAAPARSGKPVGGSEFVGELGVGVARGQVGGLMFHWLVSAPRFLSAQVLAAPLSVRLST